MRVFSDLSPRNIQAAKIPRLISAIPHGPSRLPTQVAPLGKITIKDFDLITPTAEARFAIGDQDSGSRLPRAVPTPRAETLSEAREAESDLSQRRSRVLIYRGRFVFAEVWSINRAAMHSSPSGPWKARHGIGRRGHNTRLHGGGMRMRARRQRSRSRR